MGTGVVILQNEQKLSKQVYCVQLCAILFSEWTWKSSFNTSGSPKVFELDG